MRGTRSGRPHFPRQENQGRPNEARASQHPKTIQKPKQFRDALLEEGLAEEHQWVPDSGWVTFRVRTDKDLQHAVWLMRLSYFRYSLKTAPDPRKLFVEAGEELQLTDRFKFLLEQFIPLTKK